MSGSARQMARLRPTVIAVHDDGHVARNEIGVDLGGTGLKLGHIGR